MECKYVYEVEIFNNETKTWIKEKRFYALPKNPNDFPNNSKRRNFKSLNQ